MFLGGYAGANKDITPDFLNARDGSTFRSGRVRNESSDTAQLLNHSYQPESPLDEIFKRSSYIKKRMRECQSRIKELKPIQNKCLEQNFEIKTDLLANVSKSSQEISSILEDINNSLNALTVYSSPQYPDREMIVKNIHHSLFDEYKKLNHKFKLQQTTFQTQYYSRESQKKNETNLLIDLEGLYTGNDAPSQRTLETQQRQSNNELEELVRRAREVQQLFSDLATIIVEQGTIIDRIDYNISEALTNAQKGHEEVQEAEKYQKGSKMWICAIIMGILVFILFIAALFK
ncbi:SNARE domain containing protein [Trichomonas vaginalis G3]|uniref:SNARE domain containing protein n=1 Tax=Trichomonas vaginalis (strain ATCC PRA-98 / G3) TaxID=412133 RepID=A2DQ58_TRIV3|nr:SNAP receptor protein [Trichomonas vaginalis G3]EAY17485.1 SNARE domain containing protein [Trichomonas vaginalis G3]KAI5533591.1 SNAP receptor protein [Trichomonas vaginalis G3]|eukprot:XP_001329620.1 SNARE domain containing protein [Trichomonas vaginalis G3]